MMSKEWTTGHWYARPSLLRQGAFVIETRATSTDGAVLIAEMPYAATTGAALRQRSANACLIAAAPELVEALAALVEVAPCNADDDDDPEQAQAWRNARALLARIEGGA